jgi:hypothetical protein
MERMTDKHGPRLDDALDREVQSLTEGAPIEARSAEGRRQEDVPDLNRDPLDVRADLAASVAPADWPADRETLVRTARDGHAPEEVVALLEDLPHGDRRYENVQAVWDAVT